MTTSWALYLLAIVIGSVVGSFVNVVIFRLPSVALAGIRTGSVKPLSYMAWPLSFCAYCGEQIKPWHNIPIISWIQLGGKSVCCNRPIAFRYILVELLGAVLAIACLYRFGMTQLALLAAFFCWLLLAIAWIDAERYVLPAVLVSPLLWLGLFINLAFEFAELEAAVTGAIAGYLFLSLFSEGSLLLTKKRMLGAGDPKLFAAIGAWLGWHALPGVLMLAALTASVYGISKQLAVRGKRNRIYVPFGPHLAVAGVIMLLFGQWLVPLYVKV